MNLREMEQLTRADAACCNFAQKLWHETTPADLDALKTELATLVGNLRASFSDLAKRNIVVQLQRWVEKVGQLPGLNQALLPDLNRLKPLLTSCTIGHSIYRSRYDAALCLGYRVKTAFAGYSGAPDDWEEMRRQCDDMTSAIRAARAGLRASESNSSSLLKIFMAPEFFFRGRRGAYDAETISGGTRPGLVALLQKEIDQPIYKDWLFVLGTAVVAAAKADEQTGFTRAAVENFAIVSKERAVYTFSKEMISGVDYNLVPGVSNTVLIQPAGARVVPALVAGTVSAQSAGSGFSDERMGGSIFTIDGVTFGMEICLDHIASSTPGQGRLDHADGIQVQLIPSAGMCISKLKTVAHGIVFNVDGTTPHIQVFGVSQALTDALVQVGVAGPALPIAQLSFPGYDGMNFTGAGRPLGEVFDYSKAGEPSAGWAPDNLARVMSAPNGAVVAHGPFVLPPP